MKIFVTGLPRCRSTETVNLVSKFFNLPKPNNKWGELQLEEENIDQFLKQEKFVTKIWPIHFDRLIAILEQADFIIFCSTDDYQLWKAKMINAMVDGNFWSLDSNRDIKKISLKENSNVITEINKHYMTFKKFHEEFYQRFDFVLKTTFVIDGKVFSHCENKIDQKFINLLIEKMSDFKKRKIENYITENEDYGRKILSTN